MQTYVYIEDYNKDVKVIHFFKSLQSRTKQQQHEVRTEIAESLTVGDSFKS